MTEKELLSLLGTKNYEKYKANEEWWAERQAKAQDILTAKTQAETEKQLKKYYRRTMNKAIGQFEKTYNTYLLNVARGLESSPATLYKLDTYWQTQAMLRDELQKLGDLQSELLSRQFIKEYMQIYQSIALHDGSGFAGASPEAAQQIIRQIWCADGSSWKSRIWKNMDKLQDTLNEGLVDCVIGGADSRRLKNRLVEDFNVSYTRADTIVRTELNHIQAQAARQRYADAGIKEVEVWADKDERRCEICGKLHQKRFPVGAQMPIPAHPRCRCRIIPVIEIEPVENEQLKIEEFYSNND